ncbi:hypothetical protein [Corallococcus caeni]|uniref:EcxA zinc-binding domain-containing protein n=1 Tax=Corallococcus caeni TaxID=3082388 RepID=A0ABQ6QZM3_9BACT|nr:hypothetical protein ASNO1_57520 [Corallococcus sp. NO1]
MDREILALPILIGVLSLSGCATRALSSFENSSGVIDRVQTLNKVTAQVECHGYDDPANAQKAQSAILLMERVLNSPNFREKVKGFKFNKRGRNGNLGYSNDEVLAIVLSGTDIDTLTSAKSEQEIKDATPGVLKLKLNLDKVSPREIGHTNLETNEIFTGVDWFRDNDLCEIAGHYLHEYTHTVGFGHTFFDVFNRASSVPYGLGDIGVDVAKELTGGTCTHSPVNP